MSLNEAASECKSSDGDDFDMENFSNDGDFGSPETNQFHMENFNSRSDSPTKPETEADLPSTGSGYANKKIMCKWADRFALA